MNLKEAFRFQNQLTSLMEEAKTILLDTDNTMKVRTTYQRSRVMADATDETVLSVPPPLYSERINEVADFLIFLLEEREKLSAAVWKAKCTLPLTAGLDGEVSLNRTRQEVAKVFRQMTGLRSKEEYIANGGTGYRFNNDGNQVSYRCDIHRVTTINFDRNKMRRLCTKISQQADEVSTELDKALLNTQVAYEQPFDVNDTFAEAFETFAGEPV